MKVILKVEPNRDGAAVAKSLILGEGYDKVELQFNGTLIWPIDLARIARNLESEEAKFDIMVQA